MVCGRGMSETFESNMDILGKCDWNRGILDLESDRAILIRGQGRRYVYKTISCDSFRSDHYYPPADERSETLKQFSDPIFTASSKRILRELLLGLNV